MAELKGRCAIVTGAAGGIGSEIVEKLAREGVNLVISGRTEEKLKALQEAYKKSSKIIPVVSDVSKRDDLQKIVDTAIKNFKKIDFLINCVGVSSQHSFWEQPLDEIEKVIWTNYYGYVMLTRLAVPFMKEQKFGHIVNITSGSVLVDPPPRNFIVYTSLKVGLRAWAKGLFWEMRDFGIKVTSIFPGVTRTPLTGKLKDIDDDRLMDPKDVADAVVYALQCKENTSVLEISVINQQTPWTKPVIPFKQDHPKGK